MLFLDQDNFSSDLSQILILQYPFSRASMFSLPFLPNFTLACWNPFFISFSILSYPMPPRATLIGYTKPNAKSIRFIIKLHTNKYLFGETRYLSKISVFKTCFSFKVRQHGQQQLYIQYKVCWVLYKMVGALSFSQPYLCIQLPQQCRPKIQLIFTSPFSPYLFIKSSLPAPLTLPSCVP